MSKFQIKDEIKRNNKLNITFKLDTVNNFIIFNIDEINTYLKQFISSYLWKQHTGTPITLEGIFNNQLKISTEFLDVNSSFSLEVILNNGESVRSSPLIITQDILDNFDIDTEEPTTDCVRTTLTIPEAIGSGFVNFAFVYELGTYNILTEEYDFGAYSIEKIYEITANNLSDNFIILFQNLISSNFNVNLNPNEISGIALDDPNSISNTNTKLRFLDDSELAYREISLHVSDINGTDILFGQSVEIISCGIRENPLNNT